jgi:hypothetical protein
VSNPANRPSMSTPGTAHGFVLSHFVAYVAGMESRQLLDIPRGERRHYHDDVSIIVISFEGRIWRSSV